MELSCFLCLEKIQDGIDGLGRHLSHGHGISLTEKLGDTGYVCGHGNCREAFDVFYNLRRHIRNTHMIGVENNQPPIDVTSNLDDEVGHADPHGPPPMMDIDAENGEEQLVGQHINNENIEMEVDLRSAIIKMICEFHSNASLNGATISTILDSYEKLLATHNQIMKARVLTELRRHAVNGDVISEIDRLLEFNNPVKGLKTYEQQVNAMVENCGYIEPIEFLLGDRVDMVLNRKTQLFEPKLKYPNAIRLRIYYDEAEIVGPLGSRTGIHKLGAFYFEIGNLPPHMNSQLSNIHVSTLFCSVDVKKYGFDKILGPFMDDLRKLESDEGVTLHFDDEAYILRASIETFCGDGLAVHEIFGLLGPSCNLFCRLCLYDREALHRGSVEEYERRTKEVHERQLQDLKDSHFSDAVKTATGMRGDSVLNKSKYFKTYRNEVFDLMHDYLHGNCQIVVTLVLRQWIIVEDRFKVEYLNEAISHFNYGYVENKNKPSANFTRAILNDRKHTINQKACQMWCLIRVLPFLVSGKVPENDEFLRIILLLLEIMEIKFAPTIPSSILCYLDELYRDFFNMFGDLFPEVDAINKMHHGSHGAECIESSGPLSLYNCIRFEAKHGELKLRAQNVHNFKNPPKTLIRVSQAVQCSKWNAGDVQINTVEIISGKKSFACHTKSRQYLLELGLSDSQEVISARSVKVNGIEYRTKLFIALDKSADRFENLMTFGNICEIIVIDKRVYLLSSVCSTIHFDTALHAYCIELNDLDHSSTFTDALSLPFHKPFSYWLKPASDALYISLRHLIY
ncbi:hypothetical protein QAD02_014519 [Eretmocerus hayati]|uniref:Uncharacterized protein n=1 Tax=Eretmocerus hayati TaxID=131215 RepID=A0ACC2P8F7_9HYME|nr:hypothetical protein QAD02_014519 [Eretmocerus hayati]